MCRSSGDNIHSCLPYWYFLCVLFICVRNFGYEIHVVLRLPMAKMLCFVPNEMSLMKCWEHGIYSACTHCTPKNSAKPVTSSKATDSLGSKLTWGVFTKHFRFLISVILFSPFHLLTHDQSTPETLNARSTLPGLFLHTFLIGEDAGSPGLPTYKGLLDFHFSQGEEDPLNFIPASDQWTWEQCSRYKVKHFIAMKNL